MSTYETEMLAKRIAKLEVKVASLEDRVEHLETEAGMH